MPEELTVREIAALAHALEECQVFEVDGEGIVTRWIAGAAESRDAQDAGTTPEHFSTFFTDRDRERGWPARMLEWARSEGRCKDEGWRLRSGGQRFWAEHVMAAIRDERDNVTGFIHILFDADRRWAAERAVEEADRRILEYQRVAQLGSFEYDPAEDRFLVTPEVLRVMNLSGPPAGTADFIPVPAAILLGNATPEDRERFRAGAPQSWILRAASRSVHVRCVPVTDRAGAVVRAMGTMQDVTDCVKSGLLE
jgi:PAS domain-containing protein